MRHLIDWRSWLLVSLLLFIFPSAVLCEVSLTSPQENKLVFPDTDGARIQNPRPAISIRFDQLEGSERWTSLRLLVDDVDVSPLAELTDNGLVYRPQADLAFGKHVVTLQSMDNTGTILPDRQWRFIVPHSQMFDKASAQVLTDFQVERLLLAKENAMEPEWKLQSNATLSSMVETGDLSVSLGANVWYAEQEGSAETEDNFNLNNFLLEINFKDQRLALGDLSLNGTELVSNSISRRGGLLELTYDQTTAQLFMLSSNQVTGFGNTFGLNNPDQRLFGGSLEQRWENVSDLTLKGTAVTGKNQGPDDYNSGTLVTPNDGQIYTFQVSAKPFSKKINMTGEIGLSRFDPDTTDDFKPDRAQAMLFRFSGRHNTVSYGGGYKSLDQNFHSIIDTTSIDNRSEYNLYGTKTFKESSLTVSCNNFTDNVEKDQALPVIRNTSFDLAYNLYKADWPMIFLNSNIAFQKSSDEPVNMETIKNNTQTLTGGFSLVREKWNLTPSYTFTQFLDDSIADNDSDTHQTTFTLGLQPMEKLSLNPSASWSRTDSGKNAPVTQTYQGTLAGSYLFSPMHDLFVTISAIDSDTDDDSAHTTTMDYICQYNWYPDIPILKKTRKGISLRGRYNRAEDKIADNANENYAVSLLINIGGVPVTLY